MRSHALEHGHSRIRQRHPMFAHSAFIRDAGTRHSRASRSTSPHVAPRASPDRTAVSAVKPIAALTTGPAPGRLDRLQRRGNVRVRQRPPMLSRLRGLRQCRVDHFARRVHVDMSERLSRGEHASDPTAQELSGRGLVAVDRPEHREHRRPVDLVDGSTHETRRVPRQGPPPRLSGPAAPLAPLVDLGGHVRERRHGRPTPGRAAAPLRRQAVVVRPLPSLGQPDGRVRADADIAPLPLDVEPLNLSLVYPARPALGHDQVHRVARLIPARLPQRLGPLGCQSFH